MGLLEDTMSVFENAGKVIVRVDYVNYKNEKATRTIIPGRIHFGCTIHHPILQWLMDAYDVDKVAARTFAVKDMSNWRPLEEDKCRQSKK